MKLFQVDEQLDKYNMLGRLQLAVLAGCVVVICYSVQFFSFKSVAYLKVLGVGLLASGGFLVLGFLLGFIFAIPRMAGAKSEAGPTSASSKDATSQASAVGDAAGTATATATATVETNSNLVEISDWLTKILVGVSLVELNKIPGRIQQLTSYLGNGLRDCSNSASPGCVQSSESFALGIVIFFSACGFMIGYLWTRLYLQRALADMSRRADIVDKSWQYIYAAEVRLRAGALGQAQDFIDKALVANPSNPTAFITKGRILRRLAQLEGKPGNKQLLQEALSYASKAADLAPMDAGAIYNVACYQALLGMDRQEVLKNLSRAFQLNSGLKQLALGDDDLVSLREDEEFKRLTSDVH